MYQFRVYNRYRMLLGTVVSPRNLAHNESEQTILAAWKSFQDQGPLKGGCKPDQDFISLLISRYGFSEVSCNSFDVVLP